MSKKLALLPDRLESQEHSVNLKSNVLTAREAAEAPAFIYLFSREGKQRHIKATH
jgi:hypothetical protein